MGLLDRLPGHGRRGVVVALATGVAALMAAGLLAWVTWGGDDAPSSAAEPVRVVSRKGGFAVTVPGELTGERVGKASVRVASQDQRLVITIGPGPRGSLVSAQKSAVQGIVDSYPEVLVERRVKTTVGGAPARRTVGTLKREDGGQLLFSATSLAQGKRTWSVVMFARRDVTATELEAWYQPVLDGFQTLS